MLSGADRTTETMNIFAFSGLALRLMTLGQAIRALATFQNCPLTHSKLIARSSELEFRPETKAMVQSLVTLAHNLSMQVIVEGIETPEQLAMIKQFGGNEVQGYLLGRPTADPIAQLTLQNSLPETVHRKPEKELVPSDSTK